MGGGGGIMPDLTDEEYDALDEYYTKKYAKGNRRWKRRFFYEK
jgi:hypothetical protein